MLGSSGVGGLDMGNSPNEWLPGGYKRLLSKRLCLNISKIPYRGRSEIKTFISGKALVGL